MEMDYAKDGKVTSVRFVGLEPNGQAQRLEMDDIVGTELTIVTLKSSIIVRSLLSSAALRRIAVVCAGHEH